MTGAKFIKMTVKQHRFILNLVQRRIMTMTEVRKFCGFVTSTEVQYAYRNLVLLGYPIKFKQVRNLNTGTSYASKSGGQFNNTTNSLIVYYI